MNQINIQDIDLNYLDLNEHKEHTLLFIHGNSHSLRTFSKQMNDSKLNQFRLVFVDLPGHGLSEKKGEYSVKHFGGIISDFIKVMKLKNFIIVGHSLGGHVAINTLTSISPRGLFLFGTPPLKKPVNVEAFLPNENTAALNELNPSLEQIELLLNEMNYEGATKDLALEDFLRSDQRIRKDVLGHIISNNYNDEALLLHSFNRDCMFLLASKESLINNKYIRSEFGNDSRFKIVEMNSKHSPHIEASSEFNSILFNFSNEVFNGNIEANNQPTDESHYEQRD